MARNRAGGSTRVDTPFCPEMNRSILSRLVLFDRDGTLVDSAAVIGRAFTAHGLAPPPPAEVRAIIGLSLPRAIATLVARHAGVPVPELVEAYKDAYRDNATAGAMLEAMFPGARETLAALDDGETLLGVVTGKSRRGLDRTLQEHNVADRFAVVVTADDASSNPARDMVLKAMALTGSEASRSVVIGDTTFDIEMAVAAGVPAIGVAWGYHDAAHLEATGAPVVATQMAQMPRRVDRLLAEPVS